MIVGGLNAPAIAHAPILLSAVLVAFVYVSVWLGWRPMRFELEGDQLRIVWPVRSRSISARAVLSARVLTSPEFRREFGYGMRIGAGGLWGGFGLLKTRTATFSMWISRLDRMVLVELRGARPLLITPERPEEFVQAVVHAAGSHAGSFGPT
jgi:Bacterial PH domain